MGSPPRVRGKLIDCRFEFAGVRITPACAGKTGRTAQGKGEPQDHPRVCGENLAIHNIGMLHKGSPPRVRGKQRARVCAWYVRGITPACAGKTSGILSACSSAQDHPRVCGENPYGRESHGGNQGSPPRVRGKPLVLGCMESLLRITPACAGKTLWKWRISVVDPSPQPQSSLTSRRADASSGSQRAPCAAPV